MAPQQAYDPVLAVWQRRRARDAVFMHEKNVGVDLSEQVRDLQAAIIALSDERRAYVERLNALEDLISKIAHVEAS